MLNLIKGTPPFQAFMAGLAAVALLALMMEETKADTLATPYASLGIGKRDCNLTSSMICDNKKIGSNTPGFIEAGLILEPTAPVFYMLWADQVDIGWRHQSYANRGWLIPGVLNYGGEESQIDSYAINFIWKFQTLSFNLPF